MITGETESENVTMGISQGKTGLFPFIGKSGWTGSTKNYAEVEKDLFPGHPPR